jgi:O-antigen ligase
MSFQNNKSILILNLLIALIPISYILGNLLLNLNIFLIIICSFILFKLDIFRLNLNFIDKLLIFLFLYIATNGVLNNFLNFKFPDAPDQNIVLLKSFLYLRFIFLYFAIKFLIYRDLINFKIIFVFFGLCGLFVSIDVIIQFAFGKDLFGFESSGRRLSGPFGEELISGSFIQRFFVFIPFTLLAFYKIKKNIIFQISFSIISIISILGLILSGNRIPLLLFICMLPLLAFYEKTLRKNILATFLVLIISLITLMNNSSETKSHYIAFMEKGTQIINYTKYRILTGEVVENNIYIKEIEQGILTWKENKYFGGGVKSFRWHCNSVDRSKMLKFVSKKGRVNCNNHPHNYYIQIAAELGVVGLVTIIIIFMTILVKSIRKLHFSNIGTDTRNLLIPFFLMFILEFFPFKTTGSFFSTTNANYIFIILPFVVGLIERKKI